MPDRVDDTGQSTDVDCPVFHLSPREVEVLTLAAQGHTDAEIARRLYLVPRTIRGYVQSARQRLGALNRTQAVAIAILAGLIETDIKFLIEAHKRAM